MENIRWRSIGGQHYVANIWWRSIDGEYLVENIYLMENKGGKFIMENIWWNRMAIVTRLNNVRNADQ